MLDADERVIHPTLARKPKLTKGQKEFLKDFVTAKQEEFERVMKDLQEYAPTKWADLYLKVTQMVVPKESNLNVNIGLNRDFQELVNLGRTSSKRLTSENMGELEVIETIDPVNEEHHFREQLPSCAKRMKKDDVDIIDEDTYK